MFRNINYDREEVFKYAQKWALSRNPQYINFDTMGGDCTNFASQCIYAGCGIMNFTKDIGWYYKSVHDRSAAWSGVEYLYKFLINNYNKDNSGPYGIEVDISQVEIGDIIQLGDDTNHFYHSLVVTGIDHGSIYVSTHTYDSFMRPLDSYIIQKIRCIHIAGCRKQM